jgi:hypothetical protein
VIDCGAHSALAHEAFTARGVTAFRAQFVQRYTADAQAQWRTKWGAEQVSDHWIGDEVIYHEGNAILAGRRRGEIVGQQRRLLAQPAPGQGLWQPRRRSACSPTPLSAPARACAGATTASSRASGTISPDRADRADRLTPDRNPLFRKRRE